MLVLVHGFKNDMKEVIARTDDLHKNQTDQGWHGVVVAFALPSRPVTGHPTT